METATKPPMWRFRKAPQTPMDKGMWRLWRFKPGGQRSGNWTTGSQGTLCSAWSVSPARSPAGPARSGVRSAVRRRRREARRDREARPRPRRLDGSLRVRLGGKASLLVSGKCQTLCKGAPRGAPVMSRDSRTRTRDLWRGEEPRGLPAIHGRGLAGRARTGAVVPLGAERR